MQNTNPQAIFLKNYTVPDYLIEEVELHFDLTEAYTTVKSQLTIQRNAASPAGSSDLILVGDSVELEHLILDGITLIKDQYQLDGGLLTIFQVPSTFILEIQTRIKPQENTSLSGLYKSSGNFCTQCEAEGFRRITYFLDRPDVMARYTTTIVADASLYPILLSNGNLVGSGQLAEGRHWATWKDPFKKPSYLFALVAGKLECIKDEFTTRSGRKIALQIYVETGNSDKCDHAMQAVKKAMRWDEDVYQREYDLDIYMIVAVSDFNMGAMENKGLNIFNTKYILAKPETATDMDFINIESVIAHEYFHNWSGNRITCRDWFQLSLKEGLTIFRDQSFTEDTTSPTVARIHSVTALRTRQFPEDAGPLAHPVRPDSYIEINNFYTSTIYNKGAEVIRMMLTLLGPTLFYQGMDLYFERHDGQAVTIDDFVKAMEDASGRDLTQFCLWYTQAGTPLIEVQDEYNEEKQTYTLTIKQSCPSTPGQSHKLPMHIPLKMGLLDELGHEIMLYIDDESPSLDKVLEIKQAVETFHFTQVSSRPIPSLFRGFSAPIKLQYQYSDAALRMLFAHDVDEFNRWEAGQKYAINMFMALIKDFQAGKSLHLSVEFIAVYQENLQSAQQDKYFHAEMLALPSEKYLSEQFAVIDVDAIHEVREFVLLEIAKQSKDILLHLYQQNNTSQRFTFSIAEVGRRQLKNICFSYLLLLPDEQIRKTIGMQQFNDSLKQNMTDAMTALRCLNNIAAPERSLALQAFYLQWQSDTLVIDKWLSLQAISKLPDTLAKVKLLLSHEAFDIKNPNKVYALIGGFTQNLVRFHAPNGEGYDFLTDIIQQLDSLNPQIAARMVTPLTEWRRYDKKRQALMLHQLHRLLQTKALSKDVYELVSKSIASVEINEGVKS